MHKIMDPAKAAALREAFINAFVDTSTDCYKELAKIKPSDYYKQLEKGTFDITDPHGVRYMYDTLHRDTYTIVPFDRALQAVAEKPCVYSMWDIDPPVLYNGDPPRVADTQPHYLELYKPDTVIQWETDELAPLLEKELGDYKTTDYLHNTLPEDIYIFDDSFQWCVIFTHSPTREDYEERLCVICNRRAAPDPEA